MRKQLTVILLSALILSGCASGRMGNPGAIVGGAAIGGSLGSSIGGLIGDNNRGWRGGYRGSAIGNIVGGYDPIAPAANISELTEKLFRDITAHEEQLRLLFHHISTRSFIDRLIIRQRYVFSRLVEEGGCDVADNAVDMSFMIAVFAGVILDYWFLGSLPLSEKEIISNLNRLLLNFSRAKKEMKRGGPS